MFTFTSRGKVEHIFNITETKGKTTRVVDRIFYDESKIYRKQTAELNSQCRYCKEVFSRRDYTKRHMKMCKHKIRVKIKE